MYASGVRCRFAVMPNMNCFFFWIGIIDLTNMPPTILVPHAGGASTPPMDRITYIPGTQISFPPRPYNAASLSPGEMLQANIPD